MKITIHLASTRKLSHLGAVMAVAILTGCATVGPDYMAPSLNLPATWQAAVPHNGSTASLLNWWAGFQDPTLGFLLQEAEANSPTLAQAAGAIAAARASREQAAAGFFPQVNSVAGVTRTGSFQTNGVTTASPSSTLSQVGQSTARSVGLDASWEIDLFGSVWRSNEAAAARLQAREAQWHDARISLAAEVGSEYVTYRACRLLADSQKANLESLRKTEDSTKIGVDNGLIAPAELTLASAGVANASASLRAQQAECDLSVKALVALTGIEESVLRQRLAVSQRGIPVPIGLEVKTIPVQLLSQRPDLVAAERSLAAANADIGVAEASRYPRLSLLGSISVARTETTGSGVSTAPWSFGPSLSLPVFDGGKLRSQVETSRASYQTTLANYRGAVRTAVKEVEQSLVRLDTAVKRSDDVANAARDYRRYLDAATENWTAGGINLLSLEESRRNALQAEQNDISTRRDRVLYAIALYKALGGGWERNDNMTVAGGSQ
jgi:NodT family efflux transporter outer membrane factor (OMF) lipoprotein